MTGSPSSSGIRAAREGDFAAILALWSRGRSLAASVPDDEPALTRLVERDGGALLVAEDEDGRVVGTVVAAWDG